MMIKKQKRDLWFLFSKFIGFTENCWDLGCEKDD